MVGGDSGHALSSRCMKVGSLGHVMLLVSQSSQKGTAPLGGKKGVTPSIWKFISAGPKYKVGPLPPAFGGIFDPPVYYRHVRAIPWPSGRWRARRRIDTGHAGRLHSRERARGHVQPRCRGGENVGREKRSRHRHRSGCGPPASRDTHRRGRHSAAKRTCARRAGRPTWRTGGRVGLIAARRNASNRATRWRQQPPKRRCNRRRRAGTITRGSSWSRRTPKVAARGRRTQLEAVGGGRGEGVVGSL